jgi:hypothetical protein
MDWFGESGDEGTMPMRLLLAAVAAGGVSFAAIIGTGDSPEAASEIAMAAKNAGGQSFLLHVNGRASACKLTRLDNGSGLDTSAGCGDINPPIGAAVQWIETGRGGVVLAAADGEPLLELGVSDGAAYETFGRRKPMILLAPVD